MEFSPSARPSFPIPLLLKLKIISFRKHWYRWRQFFLASDGSFTDHRSPMAVVFQS